MIIKLIKKFFGVKVSYPFEFCKWLLTRKAKQRVISGPFQGMYTEDTHVGAPYCPRLLGIYEKELHEIVNNIIKNQFEEIIDIGAAEGYYAIGLAIKSKSSSIVAYEINTEGQEFIKKMALKNNVLDKIEILGVCSTEILKNKILSHKKRLIIIDVEGYEIELLNISQIHELKNAEILVELHDQFNPIISATLRERFRNTHNITQIFTENRSFNDIPISLNHCIYNFLKKWILMLISDSRGVQMSWYHMVPKKSQ